MRGSPTAPLRMDSATATLAVGIQPSRRYWRLMHEFRDGDIVDVVTRWADGSVREERVDFIALATMDGKAYLHHALFRPDSCTDLIAVEWIVDLRLVKSASERDPVELEMR